MIPAQAVDAVSTTKKLPLGTRYFDENTGKVYYYIQANEALAIDTIVTPMVALFDGDCDASSGNVLNDAAETFTAQTRMVTGEAHVIINAGTNSIDDTPNRVLSVAANALTLETPWSSDLTTSEDYVVYAPFLVENCDAAAERIVGVVPVAFAAGEYGWMQSGGLCDNVEVIGSTDAIVAHEGIISSGTQGLGKGLTNGGTTADEADKANIMALVPTALAAVKVPAILNCLP